MRHSNLPLPKTDVRRIRRLRYEDGLTCPVVAELVGCSLWTVARHAPGLPGKVPNDKLRAAYLASHMTAADVARAMGWFHASGADGSRVKRTLGLLADVSGSRGTRSIRIMIDAEVAGLMAEALGLMAWEVMPDEELNVA